MNNRRILLVDWNYITQHSWLSTQKDIDLKPWLPVMRFIDMLRMAVMQTDSNEIIFCAEREPLKRVLLEPSYKTNKACINDDNFNSFKQICLDFVISIECPFVNYDGAEVADIMGSIVNKHCHKCDCAKRCVDCKHTLAYSTSIVIFSNNQDLKQLLAYDRVSLYDYGLHMFYTREDFMEDYGFEPKLYSVYTALVGDKSRNITGCAEFGPTKAKASIQHDSVDMDVTMVEQDEIFYKTLNLINLDYELPLPEIDDARPRLNKYDIHLPYELPKDGDKEIKLCVARLEGALNEANKEKEEKKAV